MTKPLRRPISRLWLFIGGAAGALSLYALASCAPSSSTTASSSHTDSGTDTNTVAAIANHTATSSSTNTHIETDTQTQTQTQTQTETSATATLTISDSPSHNFGNVTDGTSVSYTFFLTNSGSATATGISASVLDAPFSYGGSSFPGGGDCSSTLAANGSCTFIVKFAPTSAVTSNATVTITYVNGSTSASTNRPILGTGVDPGSGES